MTTITPNLLLTLYNDTTDSTATFLAFRTAIAGVTASNFTKIDTAYGTLDNRVTDLEQQLGLVGVSATQISGNAYEATVPAIDIYAEGITILLDINVTITGAMTLNINGLGTKDLKKISSAGADTALASGDLKVGMRYLFTFDADRWVWVSATSATAINITGTAGDIVVIASDNTLTNSNPTTLIGSTIHAATAKTSLVDNDEFAMIDSAASNVLKRITWANIKTALMAVFGVLINGLTSKTTPVGADEIIIADSEASYATKKVLISNLTTGSGASFWTLMPGTPVRTGNTTFTVTGDITSSSPIAKGMVIKWTESSVIKVGMVSIPPTYGAPNSTITIIGDTMSSIDASSLKYATIDPMKILFSKAGAIGAVETDTFPAWYAEEPFRVIGADCYVGTAGTTNSTTFDINKGGTTMFTTKPTLATTVAAAPTPFTADSGTSLALNDKVTVDVDAIQTTNAIDAYIKLYIFPTRYLYLT